MGSARCSPRRAGRRDASNTPVEINCSDGPYTVLVDQTVDPAGWFLLGTYFFDLGTVNTIVIRTSGTTGHVIADAVLLAAAFNVNPTFTVVPWEDDDGDGFCNYVEWINRTDPFDPGSFLTLHLDPQPGSWRVRFQAAAGNSYSVQYCDSLATGTWLRLSDVHASNQTYEAIVPDLLFPATNAARFYRLVTPKVP